MKPIITRRGNDYLAVWPDASVKITVDRLRDSSRDGLAGYVTVEVQSGEAWVRTLGPTKYNLTNLRSQTELSNALSTRSQNGIKALWPEMVNQLSSLIAENFRKGVQTVCMSECQPSGPLSYVVPGFLPKDEVTILYADGESGKSMFAMLIAICCATGTELPWGVMPVQCNVLYLDWETTQERVHKRIERISSGLGVPIPNIYYRRQDSSLMDDLANIVRDVDTLGIGLVVCDSIGYACGSDSSLNEDQTARGATNSLNRIPSTKLVLAHVNKSTADDEENTRKVKPIGSTFFWNGMRCGWEIASREIDEDTKLLGLINHKFNDDKRAKNFAVQVDFIPGGGPITFKPTEIKEQPQLAGKLPVSEKIRAFLTYGACTLKEVAEGLGMSEDNARKALSRMPDVMNINQGKAGRGNPAVYGLTSKDL